MRYELTDYEWAAIKPMLPNKPRGVEPNCPTTGNFPTKGSSGPSPFVSLP